MKVEVIKPTEEMLQRLGVSRWPIWTCEVSKFDWFYDSEEHCFILEGEVTVVMGEDEISFGPGDFVKFPKGLQCVWEVKKPVRKHYRFL